LFAERIKTLKNLRNIIGVLAINEKRAIVLCDADDFVVIYYVVQVLIARFAFVKELKGVLFRILEAIRHEICGNTVVTHKIGVSNIAYVVILTVHLNVRVNYEMAIVVTIGIGFCTVIADQFTDEVKRKLGMLSVKKTNGTCDIKFKIKDRG
jgi:hypothetical protein